MKEAVLPPVRFPNDGKNAVGTGLEVFMVFGFGSFTNNGMLNSHFINLSVFIYVTSNANCLPAPIS